MGETAGVSSEKALPNEMGELLLYTRSYILLAGDPVIVPKQDGLYAVGQEFHIEVKEVYCKRYGEKACSAAEHFKGQHFKF